ncbi:putative transposase [Escherichia coli 6-175-07_S3_C2]|nr:putative transposase [Escherichia coli 6-175-07_S3_C2]KEM38419.1 putative transposase [Escherichia coli 6-319-05_S3_C2]KEM55338.1 putative transposase [Escherichia coli 6-319-05_S3_C3]
MPAFEWVHVQLHQQKGMISLSPPTICNSALLRRHVVRGLVVRPECDQNQTDFCLRWLR